MKKKLLALAVAAALPMGAAQAGVTIYGKIHGSIDYIDADSRSDEYWDVTSRASRLGFKGSEDLGNGLKMIWKLESGIDITNTDNGGGTLSARNRYIGLAGGWGTFLYGVHDTPMKMSTGKLDLFVDQLADYNATAGFIDRRAADAIAYVSPSMGGLTLAGAIIPDGDYDSDGDLAGGYSVAGMWTIGSVYLAAAYEDIGDLAGGADLDHWRIGAGWDIGNFFLGGVWETEDRDDGDVDKYQVSASYKFGNNVIKGMWADNDFDKDDDFGTDDDGTSWAIGWDHNFSKRSQIYIQYADADTNLNYTSTDGIPVVGEQKGFSMGMVHKF